ncbi:MAG TPA: FAD binding domain-containing protein [Stellaceae bacterium]|nr:FAD binding domain-containing protein [Stellaceae bacterium]
MKPAPFDYVAPIALHDAIALLERHGDEARPLAGGQSLVPMMAARLARPTVIVDLNRIVGLSGIVVDREAVRIGAMTRQAEALAAADLSAALPLLAQALAEVGHPATRARGTIGGSLAHADPAAELPVAMMALDAVLTISGPNGERRVPADRFFAGAFETAVKTGELLTEIRIPAVGSEGHAFLEIARRKGDFAVISAAVRLRLADDGRCDAVRIVLGGVAGAPVRCTESEERLLGERPGSGLLAAAAGRIPADAIELHSHHASRGYRRDVAPVLVRRALTLAAARAGAPGLGVPAP